MFTRISRVKTQETHHMDACIMDAGWNLLTPEFGFSYRAFRNVNSRISVGYHAPKYPRKCAVFTIRHTHYVIG